MMLKIKEKTMRAKRTSGLPNTANTLYDSEKVYNLKILQEFIVH